MKNTTRKAIRNSVNMPSELKSYVESGIIDAAKFDSKCRRFFEAVGYVSKNCLSDRIYDMFDKLGYTSDLVADQFSLNVMDYIRELYSAYNISSVSQIDKLIAICDYIMFASLHLELHVQVSGSLLNLRETMADDEYNELVCKDIYSSVNKLMDECDMRQDTTIIVDTDGFTRTNYFAWYSCPDCDRCLMCIVHKDAETINIPDEIPEHEELTEWFAFDIDEYLAK